MSETPKIGFLVTRPKYKLWPTSFLSRTLFFLSLPSLFFLFSFSLLTPFSPSPLPLFLLFLSFLFLSSYSLLFLFFPLSFYILSHMNKARIFLLVNLREFFFRSWLGGSKKNTSKSSENDQLTGHFQSFFFSFSDFFF